MLNSLNFSRSQQRIILFLIATALIASGILLVSYINEQKSLSNVRIVHSSFEPPVSAEPDTIVLPPEAEALTKPLMININKAGIEELKKLPRIGTATAKKIIEYRKQKGRFSSIKQIMDVPRIGPKTFEKIKGMIYVKEVATDYRSLPKKDVCSQILLPAMTKTSPLANKKEEVAPLAMVSSESKSKGSICAVSNLSINQLKININKANIEELSSLPGIGQVTSKKIIEYREKNGGFSSIQQIMDVPRIGPKTFEKIKDIICIEK